MAIFPNFLWWTCGTCQPCRNFYFCAGGGWSGWGHQPYLGFRLRVWDTTSSPWPLNPTTHMPSCSYTPKPYLAGNFVMVSLGQRYLSRWSGPLAHLFEESDDILADLWEADDDVVHEDVIEGGMISTLPPGLMQDQIPTVHGREEVLVLPVETKAAQVGFTGTVTHTVFCIVIHFDPHDHFELSFIRTHSRLVKQSPLEGPRAVLGPNPVLLGSKAYPILLSHRLWHLLCASLPSGQKLPPVRLRNNQLCLKYLH